MLKIIVALLLIFVAFGLWQQYVQTGDEVTHVEEVEEKNEHASTVRTPLDATYTVAGEKITLKDGVSEIEVAPGSSSKIVTRYFGNDTIVDLNADGRNDSVFMLTQETGGSGTFFYVAAALNTKDGYVGSHALLVGDRIAPQTMEKGIDGSVTVNYVDRKSGESFAIPPSVGKSLRLRFNSETMEFGELVQNFEGEADTMRMTLGMKKWEWVSAVYPDGTRITPKKEKVFTLTFGKDTSFSASTDCNSIGGKYIATSEKSLQFGEMMSTLMYCEDSQEQIFSELLSTVTMFQFTGKGELILIDGAREIEMMFR